MGAPSRIDTSGAVCIAVYVSPCHCTSDARFTCSFDVGGAVEGQPLELCVVGVAGCADLFDERVVASTATSAATRSTAVPLTIADRTRRRRREIACTRGPAGPPGPSSVTERAA